MDDLALGDTLSDIGQEEGDLGVGHGGGVETLDTVGTIDGLVTDGL